MKISVRIVCGIQIIRVQILHKKYYLFISTNIGIYMQILVFIYIYQYRYLYRKLIKKNSQIWFNVSFPCQFFLSSIFFGNIIIYA